MKNKVTAILIGAGMRGEVYTSYALDHPDELQIVGVADPNKERRDRYAKLHNIKKEYVFENYNDILSIPQFADCAFVCTQDKMHFDPTIQALKNGYHVLCEKPMSVNENEIVEMGNAAEKYNRSLTICHVLRYSPFFTKIKKIIDEGKIGDIVTIQHIEEVAFWHHAHSFVRGNWNREETSSPMILAKCCHDIDILIWLVGEKVKQVQSFGDLSYFNEWHAPEGSAFRCMDGCSVTEKCPFYAPKFYLEHPRAKNDNLLKAVSLNYEKEVVLEKLKTGPYGRCVFHCDNTVVDHQVVNLEFENGVTASMTMSAFTRNCTRKVNIMGTAGQIEGNMEDGIIKVHDFLTEETEILYLDTPETGHNGSDMEMMKEYVRFIEADNYLEGKTAASVSVDSHLVTFAAEKSRKTGEVITYEEFKNKIKAI